MAGNDSRPSNVGTAQRPSATSAMQAFDNTYQIAPQYQIVLDVRGDQTLVSDGSGAKVFPIIAALPENYNLSLSADWDSPFQNMSATDVISKGVFGDSKFKGMSLQSIASGGANLLGKAMGVSSHLKAQSLKVWNGSSGVRFNFNMVFHAQTNAKTDIRDKHIALLKLVAPTETGPGGQILTQPGPVLVDSLWNEKSRKISLQLGTYLFFDNVIIHSVGADMETLCDADGTPIAMTVALDIETFYSSFSTQDIDRAFSGAK